MKQHYLYLLCAALLAGCGKTKNAKTDAAQDRMQHRIEHNEVTVDTLQRRDFMRELISNGRLAASKRSTLSFEVSGTIAAIAAKNGSRVGAGEPIARIDTSDYALQLHKARLALDKARLGFYDVLVGQGYQAGDTVTPPAGVMQLARIRSGYADATASLLSARRSLAHCTLRAPFAGKVADVEQQVYEKSKGEFCTLLDDSRATGRAEERGGHPRQSRGTLPLQRRPGAMDLRTYFAGQQPGVCGRSESGSRGGAQPRRPGDRLGEPESGRRLGGLARQGTITPHPCYANFSTGLSP